MTSQTTLALPTAATAWNQETVRVPRTAQVAETISGGAPMGDVMAAAPCDLDVDTRAITVERRTASGLPRVALALLAAVALLTTLAALADRGQTTTPAAASVEEVAIFGDRLSGEGQLTVSRQVQDGRVFGWLAIAGEIVPVEIPAEVLGSRSPSDLRGALRLSGDVRTLTGPALLAPSGKRWRQHVVIDWIAPADTASSTLGSL